MKRIIRIIRKILLYFFVSTIGVVILYRFVPVPATPLMLQRLIEQGADEHRTMRCHKTWKPISQISKSMQLAVVCAEDQKFLNHFGFDIEAIKKAASHNQKSKKTRGASTISQQTAKNVFLLPTRSYIRKAFEVYFTFLIEIFWSKERILEVYLNVIELGDGIYGVQAASQYFFHKDASQLTSGESAMMAAVLPNPLKYKVNQPGKYLQKRKRWIMKQMSHWGNELDFDKAELDQASDDEPEEE